MRFPRTVGCLGLLGCLVGAPVSPVSAAPEAPGAVEVRVVDPGGKAAKGVFVAVVVKAWPGGTFRVVRREGKTDAKGRITFPDAIPPGTRYGVYAAVLHAGTTLSAKYVWSGTPAQSKPVELAVAPASELALRFVDGAGKPVEGVEVGPAMRADAAGQRHGIFGDPHASTVKAAGADGIVSLPYFLPGEWVGVRVRAKGGDWEARELTVPTGKGAVVDVPVVVKPTPDRELAAGADPKKRFFLFGPKPLDVEPEKGYGVVLVLPGGDGGEGFREWVRERYDDWVDAGWVFAQPVAPVWVPDQTPVWPTATSPLKGAAFTTEDFVAAVVDEVGTQVRIDRRRVLAVSWSSSGPACWRLLSTKASPIAGHLIAMSVFHPKELEPLSSAKGRPLFLLHSPTDDRCPIAMAERGRDAARKAGLEVEWATYEGGHGWAGDSETIARRALRWLAARLK